MIPGNRQKTIQALPKMSRNAQVTTSTAKACLLHPIPDSHPYNKPVRFITSPQQCLASRFQPWDWASAPWARAVFQAWQPGKTSACQDARLLAMNHDLLDLISFLFSHFFSTDRRVAVSVSKCKDNRRRHASTCARIRMQGFRQISMFCLRSRNNDQDVAGLGRCKVDTNSSNSL